MITPNEDGYRINISDDTLIILNADGTIKAQFPYSSTSVTRDGDNIVISSSGTKWQYPVSSFDTAYADGNAIMKASNKIISLIEDHYSREVLEIIPAIITDPAQMTSGWVGNSEDYCFFAKTISFNQRNGSEILLDDASAPVVVINFQDNVDGGAAVITKTINNVIFKYLNTGDYSAYHFDGYRIKLGNDL